MSNPDDAYDDWSERAIIADLERVDVIKAENVRLKRDLKDLLRVARRNLHGHPTVERIAERNPQLLTP